MLVWLVVVALILGSLTGLGAGVAAVEDADLPEQPEMLVEEYNPNARKGITRSDGQVCGVHNLERNGQNHKVLLFLDSGYFDIFHNWYLRYAAVCGDSKEVIERLTIVCIDKETSNMLLPLKLTCSADFSADMQASMPKAFEEMMRERDNRPLVNHRGRKIVRHLIWMKRLEIVSVLLQRGEDVLLSDLDAIWLQNPYPDISAHLQAGSSVISSRATFPEEISRVWGRSLCMGFIYLKSDKFSQHLLLQTLEHMRDSLFYYKAFRNFRRTGSHLYNDRAMNRSVLFDLGWYDSRPTKEPDDQYSINHVLQSMSVYWPDGMKHPDSAKAYTGSLEMNATVYNITLLSETSYVRHCSNFILYKRRLILPYPTVELRQKVYSKVSVATVAHCLISANDAKKKQGYLVYYHLYSLPYNATEVSAWLHRDAVAMRQSRRKKIDSREWQENWSLGKIHEGNMRPPPDYSGLRGLENVQRMNSSVLLNLRKRKMTLDYENNNNEKKNRVDELDSKFLRGARVIPQA
eukprot:gene25336-30595_t